LFREERNSHLKKCAALSCRSAADTVGRRRPAGGRSRSSIPGKSGRLRIIYKICPAPHWREAERRGSYRGSADDVRDGFIHFSTAAQLAGTLQKHYAGQSGLFLVAVNADALGDALRWEPSRGGDLFPHLYGDLDLGDVTAVLDLRIRADGSHVIPELPQ
jgi:uncharacterized protein (DUF952 family)